MVASVERKFDLKSFKYDETFRWVLIGDFHIRYRYDT